MARGSRAKPKNVPPPVAVTTDEHPVWTPNLFGKQWDVFNSRKRILLLCGSRKSGKTIAAVHRICRHLWETPGARVAFFSKSVKLAKDGGTWQDLMDIAVPEWIASGIGFNFTTFDSNGVPGAKQDAQTRTAYFRIRNMYGGESECKLFSIDHDADVGKKVHGKRFSMIFFSELWMFEDKIVLAATLPSLRMMHLELKPGEQGPDKWHQWLADTNPDPETGDRSWFYKVWYQERLDPNHKQPEVRDNLGLIEMFIEENPYTTPYDKQELEAFCAGDECLYDSYVRGVHGEGARKRDRFFAGFFDRTVHVVGGGDGEGDQIDVQEVTRTLVTGWDLGGVNHAAVVMDPWYRQGDKGYVIPCFSILDELLILGEQVSLREFTENFVERLAKIEKRNKRKFSWEHWSDDSATTVYRPTTGSFDYIEIQSASAALVAEYGIPIITLQGVTKPWNSIAARVRILRMLLRQKRIWVSACCVNVINMLEHLRKGDTDKEYVLRDEYKHIFDALTYPLYMRICDELLENTTPSASTGDAQESNHFSVG